MAQVIEKDPAPASDVVQPPASRRLRLVLVGLAGVMLVVGTIGPPLFGRGTFLASDLLTNAYPWRALDDPVAENTAHHGPVGDTIDGAFPARALFADAVREGDLLGWNPYPAGGSDGSGLALSPFELAFVMFPSWYAPAAVKLGTMAVAIGFTFLFCRRLGLGRLPAVVGGLAFAGSGFMVMWTNWPHPEVAAFIPALFWATERFLQEPSTRTAPPIALALAAMLLGNFPAVVLHTLYVLVPYVLVRVSVLHRRSIRRAIGVLAGSGTAVVTGVLLVAGMLLPFMLWISTAGTKERGQHPRLFLGLETLVTTVAPKSLGLSTEGPSSAYYGRYAQVETIAFVGATTVILALAAVALPRLATTERGTREVFAGATFLFGWAAFVGGDVLQLLQHLPGFEESFVGRVRGVLGFTVAVLAAMGLQAIIERRWPQGRRQWAWAVAVTAVAGYVAAYAGKRTLDLARAVDMTDTLRASLILPVLVALAVVAALLLVRFGNVRLAGLAAAVVPLLLVVESLDFAVPMLPSEDRDTVYPTTPGIDFLAASIEDERVAAQDLTFFGNAAGMYGLRSVTGHSFHAPTWKEAVETIDPDAFTRSPTFSFLAGTNEVMTSPVLDRLGTRWFAGSPGTAPAGERSGEVTATEAACDHTVDLDDEVTVRVPADGGLRGLVLRVCSPAEIPADAAIEIENPDLSVPARLPLGEAIAVGQLALAVPAEDPGEAAETQVRLTLTGADGAALELAATPDGDPIADTVRPADDGLRLAYIDDLLIYERTRALPRIRWAGSAIVETDSTARLDLLATAGAVPEDTVVLSEDTAAGSGEAADVEVALDAPTSIQVDVDAGGEGWLVVADALQTGWSATVDGEAAEMIEADHAGVAVRVPEGEHRVVLTYTPEGRRAGVAVSAISFLGLAGVWLWGERRHRRLGAT